MKTQTEHTPIIIIGNGISGVTAARHIRRKSNIPITIISEETPYFYSRTALMYVFMGQLPFEQTQPYENSFWEQNKIDLLQDRVIKILPNERKVVLEQGTEVAFSDLIIATGSQPNFFNWPGQELKAVQGFYHKKDLEHLELWSKSIRDAVIVGGGLIGVEVAEMLKSRGINVHFFVRESSFWNTVLPAEESVMINKEIQKHGINLLLNTELKEILSEKKGDKVGSVKTNKDEIINCQWVGITVGVSPNIDFIKESGIAFNRGILVNRYLETNIPHIFAIGDCAEHKSHPEKRKKVESVWYTGRMMGETVAATLTGTRSIYAPGHWFNSAKFFDIEYQTYGWVNTEPNPKEEQHLVWQHPKKNLLIRIAFHPESRVFLGINSLGIRLRHENFDRILTEKRSVEEVLSLLSEANFDPEFYKKYETQIVEEFKKKLNEPFES
ncbi:FAD-dependent oxidoreductase [Flavobacteriaceae bacterium]|nr:FAD-dependent oxidoreductase [Flavobacteriaceae bacterium]